MKTKTETKNTVKLKRQ